MSRRQAKRWKPRHTVIAVMIASSSTPPTPCQSMVVMLPRPKVLVTPGNGTAVSIS